MVFSLLMRFYNPHCYLQHNFIIPQNKHGNPSQSFSILSSPQPLATTNLLSVSIDLPILDLSYKWNHMYDMWLFVFLRFIQVIAYIRILLLLWLKNIPEDGYTTFCISVDGYLGYFHFLTSISYTVLNIHV